MRGGTLAAAVTTGAVVLAPALGPAPVEAQAAREGGALGGAVLGAAVGATVGFVVAGLTDYALEEGGAMTGTWLGGGLGALAGWKLSASSGRRWRTPPRLQVTLPLGVAWTSSSEDIASAFSASGYEGEDTHHGLVPAMTVTFDVLDQVRVGGEISGIRAVSVRGEGAVARLTESVEGQTYSMLVALGMQASEHRRLTYSGGAGLDRHAITALSYFDQTSGQSIPPDIAQPHRYSRAREDGWGAHARGGLELHLTYDVSLKVELVRRWNAEVTVPGVRLVDSGGATVAALGAHTLSLKATHLTFGVGLRF